MSAPTKAGYLAWLPAETFSQRRAREARETPSVWRWALARWSEKHGAWTLAAPASQGRFTHATQEEAAAYRAAVAGANSLDTLRQVYGSPLYLAVKPIECWPVHFDPRNVWLGEDRPDPATALYAPEGTPDA